MQTRLHDLSRADGPQGRAVPALAHGILMQYTWFKQLHLVGGRQLFRREGALAARNEASVSEVLHHAYVWSADCASNWLMYEHTSCCHCQT